MNINPKRKTSTGVQTFWRFINQIVYDLFITSFFFYLIFTWIDRATHRYISEYFSLNIILVIVFASGFWTFFRKVRK